MARGAAGRTVARSLFPRRLHLAVGGGRDRLSEQAGGLRPADARGGSGADHPRRQAPVRQDRPDRGVAQLGPDAHPSPHVHCLVPGGGVALDGQRWVVCKSNFFLSVYALSKTFRRIFLEGLDAAFRRSELGFFGDLARLAEPVAFAERVRALRQSSFVVYAKPPFGGPERVLAYLARYTHRTAIANSRLVAVDDDEVSFSYKDYRRGGRSRVMRIAPHEFIRRFLLHVLPDGFHRIRHYGFLANGARGLNLARVRDLLERQIGQEPGEGAAATADGEPTASAHDPFAACPDCGGLMRRIGCIPAARAFHCDTS